MPRPGRLHQGAAPTSIAVHVRAIVEFQDGGAEVFDYGNSIRDEARKGGTTRRSSSRLRAGLHPAAVLRGQGPIPLGGAVGRPRRHRDDRQGDPRAVPRERAAAALDQMAGERVHFQGLPARICWLGYGERHLAGSSFNDMVARGELKAPLVIGRDHLDCGSVASPYRETEAMLDGSDAIADWPLLNAIVNIASGASWVSIRHGGWRRHGSLHPRRPGAASRTAPRLAAEKIHRVLTNDPGMGVIRHVDAGYERASTSRTSGACGCRWRRADTSGTSYGLRAIAAGPHDEAFLPLMTVPPMLVEGTSSGAHAPTSRRGYTRQSDVGTSCTLDTALLNRFRWTGAPAHHQRRRPRCGRLQGRRLVRVQQPRRARPRDPGPDPRRRRASWAGPRARGPAPSRSPGRWPSAW